jgi:hypothetical protein
MHCTLVNCLQSKLEGLTEQSRELYERLVVLRFKAYSHEVKGTTEPATDTAQSDMVAIVPTPAPEVTKEEIASEKPIAFSIQALDESEKTQEVPSNQVTLLDVIEEVMKEEQPVTTAPEATPIVSESPSPQFKSDLFAAKTVNTPLPGAQESLNDRLAKSIVAVESIASKLESTPISDLKKAISLNQRFQFSKELFKGNNQDYEVSIDRLNSATRDEAMRQIASLRSKYAWKEDSPIAADFIDLVERRFS